IAKRHVFHRGPGSRPILVSYCELDGKSILSVDPVLLEEIAFNQYSPGVLKLEEVLHRPMYARIRGIVDFPRKRLEEIVAAHLDIGGNEIWNSGVSPSEHDILAGRFQIIVDDLERPGAVGGEQGLGIGDFVVKVREVGIDHRSANAVHENAAP